MDIIARVALYSYIPISKIPEIIYSSFEGKKPKGVNVDWKGDERNTVSPI
jgi:hypothetical protein